MNYLAVVSISIVFIYNKFVNLFSAIYELVIKPMPPPRPFVPPPPFTYMKKQVNIKI